MAAAIAKSQSPQAQNGTMEPGEDNRLFERSAPAPSPKRLAGVALAMVIVGASCVVPLDSDLSRAGAQSLGLLFGCVALWFCGSLPQGMTGMLGVIGLIALGVRPSLPEALSGFTAPTTWFILSVFCMTALMQVTSLGKRMTGALIRWAGADSRKLVFSFMLGTSLASFFMTDTGAVVLGMSMALPLLEAARTRPGSSNLGKCLMLGIAFAGVLGGFALPCGHSLNMLGLGIMEQVTGETVSFLGWMVVGIPIFAVMLPLTFALLVRVFPPEDVSGYRERIERSCTTFGPLDARDKKALVVLVLLPALWIASNWIPAINTTVVAMVGMVLLFVPGIDLMSWRQFQDIAGWNVFLFFGSVMCLGDAVTATGGTDFIARAFLESGVMQADPLLVLLLAGYVMYLIHTFCPVAPALCMLFLPPLLLWAQQAGVPTVVPVFVMASITAGSFLVPLNPTIVLTYETGYYRFSDVARGGWLSAVVFVLVTVCWAFLSCAVLGWVGPIAP